jgi:hypothetical protein
MSIVLKCHGNKESQNRFKAICGKDGTKAVLSGFAVEARGGDWPFAALLIRAKPRIDRFRNCPPLKFCVFRGKRA